MNTRRVRMRAALASVTVSVTVLVGATAGAAQAAPTGDGAEGKIAPQVSSEVQGAKRATFWVMLNGRADLAGARRMHGKARTAEVYRSQVDYADRSQAGLRGMLAGRKATFTPYWIANTVKVTGDATLLKAVAARPEVSRIVADVTVPLPPVQKGAAESATQQVEWNIDRIGASRVWNELGVRGAGTVVANIDTGVQYDHPALAASYRGRGADGSYNHNYQWFDPYHACAPAAPCDNYGHGTHTMGTMVGLDGTTSIGVAPQAQWIAAKGCQPSGCTAEALLASGQWILAPTDLNGQNPRPDLAPDIVNNSWGSYTLDPWYSQIVDSWVAAGIFPAFSNGNAGPACGTSGTPGIYSASYASGAFDINNAIASFSSRGPGLNGEVKPNLAAPGVNVRSSVPGGGYAVESGTSMASPHTAGAVALLWSAVPSLNGDVATTRSILDDTAVDVDDVSCGGTPAFNNIWGQGRLDAFSAVSVARQPGGALTGTVTCAGQPAAGAGVRLTGPLARSMVTAANGGYRFGRLPVGQYEIRIKAFGCIPAVGTVAIAADSTATFDAALAPSPAAHLSGTVSANVSGPAVDATVTLVGTPLTAQTDSGGHYQITVPQGEYDVRTEASGACTSPLTRHVEITGDTVLDVPLTNRSDRFGYVCARSTAAYVAGTDRLTLTGDDVSAQVYLPFSVVLYGNHYEQAWVSTNGFVTFSGAESAYSNTNLPDPAVPNTAAYAFWDDLFVDDQGGVYTGASDEGFVVEWRNVRPLSGGDDRISISAMFRHDGSITYAYRGIQGSSLVTGSSATIGIENRDGTDGLAYAYNVPAAVADGFAVAFRPPATVAATFNVTCATSVGQNVFVVGNLSELGQWDPERAVPTSAATYPVWAASLALSANTSVEFKYIIKNPDGSVQWEPGNNRTAVTPPNGQYVTHDTFGDQ